MNDHITLPALCLSLAAAELGTREVAGQIANRRILAYLETVMPDPQRDEIPWCSAFMNWICQEARAARTRSPLARSWTKLPGFTKIGHMNPGDIVVFRRGQAAWQGHVAFALYQIGMHTVVLGGNQANSVSIAAYRTDDVLGWVTPTMAE